MHIAALAPVRRGFLHIARRPGGLLEQAARKRFDGVAQVHQPDDVRLGDPAGGTCYHAASSSTDLTGGASDRALTRSGCVRQRTAINTIVIAASAPSNSAGEGK